MALIKFLDLESGCVEGLENGKTWNNPEVGSRVIVSGIKRVTLRSSSTHWSRWFVKRGEEANPSTRSKLLITRV
ncbi:hypothetical protein ACROYT_G041366 [Oculina patagonica]